MNKIDKHIEKLKEHRLSTIVRTDDYDHAYKIIKASNDAGIKFIEVTLTVPNAFDLIKKCRQDFPELLIGAGTVLTLDQAKKAINHDAQYLVSPVSDVEILKWANSQEILFVAGALTPTEMYNLHINGAKLIKLFPANSVPFDFINLIKNPHPEFNFLSTGGINSSNIKDFLKNGSLACGVTADLGGAKKEVTYEELLKIAKKYVALVAEV